MSDFISSSRILSFTIDRITFISIIRQIITFYLNLENYIIFYIIKNIIEVIKVVIKNLFPIIAAGWISIPVKNLDNWDIILANILRFNPQIKLAKRWKKTALTPG